MEIHILLSPAFILKSNVDCPIDNTLQVTLISTKILSADQIAKDNKLETHGLDNRSRLSPVIYEGLRTQNGLIV